MYAKGNEQLNTNGAERAFITLNIYSLNITNKKQKIVRLDFFFFNVLLQETCPKY